MDMLKTQFQGIINIIVIVTLVGSVIMGVVAFIPSHNPVGPLLGKVLTSKGVLSGMLDNLDPVALAEALRENPNMLSDLMAELGPENARKLAEDINENPEFIAVFLANSDPKTLAYMLNDPKGAEFTAEVTKYLDPAGMAGVLNQNGPFVAELLGELDPQVIAGALNMNGAFLAASTAAMDPAVLAKAVNENGAFIANLMSFLDPVVLAGAVNANPNVVSDLMGYLDTGVVAGVVNETGPWVAELLGYLDPEVLTAGMNSHPTFLSRLMSHLDPAVIAGVLNQNSDSNKQLLMSLSDQLLSAILSKTAGDQAWLSSLMGKLNPDVLANMANAGSALVGGLINSLDPKWVASVANSHPDLVFKVMDSISPDLVATMLNNGSVTAKVLPLIDTAAIGAALGEHPGLVSRLIPLLDPALGEVSNNALKGNPELASATIANLDGAQIARALAQAPAFLSGLVSGISGSMVGAILRGSDSNPWFMINLTNNLDASAIAQAVDLSGAFLPSLLAILPENVAVAAAQGLNANPALIDTVLKTSNPATIANILNSGAADNLIAGIIPLLSDEVAKAIAEGVNADAADTSPSTSMVRSLIISTNPDVLAGAINENGPFVTGLLANLNQSVAQAIAAGMNASVVDGSGNYKAGNMVEINARYLNGDTGAAIAEGLRRNPGIIEPLVKGLQPQVGKAIAEGLNRNISDFNLQLMQRMSGDLGRAIALGLGENSQLPELMGNLLSNLNTDASSEIAEGLNLNSAPGGPGFLTAMLGASGGSTAIAIARALNSLPVGSQENLNKNFLYGVLTHLDENTASDIAHALNAYPGILENILLNLDGEVAAKALATPEGEAFLTSLMDKLDGAALAKAINRALDDSDPETGGKGKKFISDLVSVLDPTPLARGLNDNQELTKQFLAQAAIDPPGPRGNLGQTLGEILASSEFNNNFLVDLLVNLRGDTMAEALTTALNNHNSDLPIPGHNMFECTWFLVDSYLQALPGIPLVIYCKAWANFIGFEVPNPYPSP
jgi:hypothetical protein